MKVHLLKEKTIREYIKDHADAVSSFEAWLTKIKHAAWTKPRDIRELFGSADLLGKSSNRVVFDIGGNSYRMICTYRFRKER